MTAPVAHWQLDRVSPAACEAAKTAAHGAGMSLSAWLTALIRDAGSAEGIPAPPAPSSEPAVIRATTMVVAPVSVDRPPPVPAKVPEGKS